MHVRVRVRTCAHACACVRVVCGVCACVREVCARTRARVWCVPVHACVCVRACMFVHAHVCVDVCMLCMFIYSLLLVEASGLEHREE